MKKKIEQSKKLLDRILLFANEADEKKLRLRLTAIWALSNKERVNISPPMLKFDFSLISNEDLAQGQPLDIQYAVCLDLQRIIDGEPVTTILRAKIPRGFIADGPIMDIVDADGDDRYLSNVMIHLMVFLGVKAVRKCPGCNRFFIITKTLKKKACSNRCRQRAYQAQLDPKKKQKIRLRRSELYRRNKE